MCGSVRLRPHVAVQGVRLVSVSPLDLDWPGTVARADDPHMVVGSETMRKPVPREGNFSVVGTPGKSCDRHVGARKFEFIASLEFSNVEVYDVRLRVVQCGEVSDPLAIAGRADFGHVEVSRRQLSCLARLEVHNEDVCSRIVRETLPVVPKPDPPHHVNIVLLLLSDRRDEVNRVGVSGPLRSLYPFLPSEDSSGLASARRDNIKLVAFLILGERPPRKKENLVPVGRPDRVVVPSSVSETGEGGTV